MSQEFLDKLRDKLELRGEQTRLAEAVGADPSGLSRLKDQPAGSTSKLVAPICAFYGWSPPLTTPDDERAAALGRWAMLGSRMLDAGKLQEALDKVSGWWEIEEPSDDTPDDD